jgi:hypothetical protein
LTIFESGTHNLKLIVINIDVEGIPENGSFVYTCTTIWLHTTCRFSKADILRNDIDPRVGNVT